MGFRQTMKLAGLVENTGDLTQGHLSNSPIAILIVNIFKLPVPCILSTSDKLSCTAFCVKDKSILEKRNYN